MSIVTVTELHQWMSEPEWSPAQKKDAAIRLMTLEGQLEDALYDAPISPRHERTETVPVGDSGTLFTKYPVFSVSEVDGSPLVLDAEHPESGSWHLEKGHVFVDLDTYSTTLPHRMTGVVAHTRSHSSVRLRYRPGWGRQPALVGAILKKAADAMINAHDDTMIARGTDSTKPPPPPPSQWTQEDLLPLGVYRNLTAWR